MHSRSARGEYTRRARRIMGICGRQVAKLYREAGNKRANGSYVRREILWRRVCNGLGTRACGLTSIKPSKSYYLSRLATGGLILLFNVCSLSLSLFLSFFLAPSSFASFPFPLLFFRGIIFFAARPTFHPPPSSFRPFFFSFLFFSLPISLRESHARTRIGNERVFARGDFNRWRGKEERTIGARLFSLAGVILKLRLAMSRVSRKPMAKRRDKNSSRVEEGMGRGEEEDGEKRYPL